jgi:excisionase family DNA binding protein
MTKTPTVTEGGDAMALSDQTPVGAKQASKVKEFYTTGDVAAMFGVTRQTVLNWCERGRLPSVVTPGGQRRIPVSALGGHEFQTHREALQTRLTAKLAGQDIPTDDEIAETIRSRRS